MIKWTVKFRVVYYQEIHHCAPPPHPSNRLQGSIFLGHVGLRTGNMISLADDISPLDQIRNNAIYFNILFISFKGCKTNNTNTTLLHEPHYFSFKSVEFSGSKERRTSCELLGKPCLTSFAFNWQLYEPTWPMGFRGPVAYPLVVFCSPSIIV